MADEIDLYGDLGDAGFDNDLYKDDSEPVKPSAEKDKSDDKPSSDKPSSAPPEQTTPTAPTDPRLRNAPVFRPISQAAAAEPLAEGVQRIQTLEDVQGGPVGAYAGGGGYEGSDDPR
jgi:hypothetical protein